MKNISKLLAIVLATITVISVTACGVKLTPLDMTNDEMESKILDLESQVADLESQLGNIESAVNIPDGTVKTSYEELLAVCKDIFEQTVETDLECIEDPDFGVPEGIDKTGFISATWRTNDSDTEPTYFVTIWYDVNCKIYTFDADFFNTQMDSNGTRDIINSIDVFYRTQNNEKAWDIAVENIS